MTASLAAGGTHAKLPALTSLVPGKPLPRLSATRTYTADALPLGIRVAPTAGWRGGQSRASQTAYGRIVLGRDGGGSEADNKTGVVVLVMATPVIGRQSAAATVTHLRPPQMPIDSGSFHGVMYEPTVWLQPGSRPPYFSGLPASLARFYGYGFDAGLDWPSSLYPPKPTPTTAFYPFSRPSVLAPDRIDLRAAARALHFTPHTARFIVLDVRGHTVVISIATEARSVEKPPYPDVLEAIRPTLDTIRFT